MKLKKILNCGFLSLFCCVAQAGENNVSVGIGANLIGAGITYERKIAEHAWFGVGISPSSRTPMYSLEDKILAVPFTFSTVWGDDPHKFEAGLGLTYIHGKYNMTFLGHELKGHYSDFVDIPFIGYRYMPEGKGWTFRAVFAPILDDGDIFWGGGFGIGYTF